MKIAERTINTGIIKRNSNIELLRIITMLFIVAHHYVGESHVSQYYDWNSISFQMYFLQVFGMWGKTGINIFILISGYFLCVGRLKWSHYFKLWFQIKTYRWIIYIILIILCIKPLTIKEIPYLLFGNLIDANNSFSSSFLFFYMFVPFYNILLKNINRWQLLLLILGLFLYFSIASTFFLAKTMNEPFWYMTLYFIAAYIRYYPTHLSDSLKLSTVVLIILLVLSLSSVIVIDYLHIYVGGLFIKLPPEYFVWYNNILSPLIAIAVFLVFKNLPEKHNYTVNKIATTCFGVLLFHTNLYNQWGAYLNAKEMLASSIYVLIIHSIYFVTILFTIGVLVDFLRQYIIERPVMKLLNNNEEKITTLFVQIKKYIMSKTA